MITEAEAYARSDPASYSFNGKNKKNRAMFENPGTIFVYDLRGWPTLNIVCQEPGTGVLIRAMCPDETSFGIMLQNRQRYRKSKLDTIFDCCSRPGVLGIALGLEIDYSIVNYPSIDGPDYALYFGTQQLPIIRGVRVNVPKNPTPEWRWVSRPR
jgi:DNA-3-methyladenine glycosylase